MIQEFAAFIKQQQLFSPSDSILLAVSGGIDSVVLTDLCYQTGCSFAIAHCNFRLRGEESEGDEQFVRSLAERYGAACHIQIFDTFKEADRSGESTQMAARRLRYQWFEELLRQGSYVCLATAHHKNDVLETILFNLTKGTGIAGLRGMPVRNGKTVRPLLFASRDGIVRYAAAQGLAWREDSSNASVKYARNLIRLQVVPALQQINPALLSTLDNTLERLQETEKIMQHYVAEIRQAAMQQKGENLYWSMAELKKVTALPLVLTALLKDYGFQEPQARTIAAHLQQPDRLSSGQIFASAHWRLNIDRQFLILSPVEQPAAAHFHINQPQGELSVGQQFKLTYDVLSASAVDLQADASLAVLDLNALQFPLEVRPWQAGDWFRPLGMKGKKKLSDFLVDRKIPLNLKQKVYVLVSGASIAWVIGYRIDERFKVRAATRQVFHIQQEGLS